MATDGQVAVLCRDPSHEGHTVEVRHFLRSKSQTFDLDGEQVTVPNNWTAAMEGDTWDAAEKTDPDVWLSGDEVHDFAQERDQHGNPMVGKVMWSPDVAAAGYRLRWDLRCELCGLNVTARRETLVPILDKLTDNGVAEIELAHLARILG